MVAAVRRLTSGNVKVSRADKRRDRYQKALGPLSGRRRLAEAWRWFTSEFKRLPVDRQNEITDRVVEIAADMNRKAGDR